MARDDECGFGRDAARAVERHVKRLRKRRRRHAGRPQNRVRADVRAVGSLPDRHASLVDTGHDRVGPHLDAEPLERAARGDAQRFGKCAKYVRAAFEQDDARRFRLDPAKVVAQRLPRDLRQRAGHLHTRRPSPDDHDRQQPPLRLRIDRALRHFERQQDALPNAERVVERLQTRRKARPLVVTEVRMRRAAREDEVVERDRLVVIQQQAAADRIDRLHFCEQDLDVLLVSQNPPDRRGDVGGRQRRGRHLIKQRLKEGIVVPIEQRDLDRRTLERTRGKEPAEPSSDDHNASIWQASSLIYVRRDCFIVSSFMRSAAVAVVIVGAVAVAGHAQSSSMSGRVVADATGDAIPNARVTLSTAALGTPVVLTDANGRFAFTAPSGRQSVVASKSGYARSEATPAIAGQPIEVRLRRGATISGRVVDGFGDPVVMARVSAQTMSSSAANPTNAATGETDDRGEYRLAGSVRGRVVSGDGRSLSHAQVRLISQNDFRLQRTASADEDGRFEFADLPAGKFGVIASKTGYSPVGSDESPLGSILNSARPFDLAEGETRERVDVSLVRWGTLAGRVFDELGDPIQGVSVQVLHIRYEAGRRRLVAAGGAAHATDDLGRYRLYALAPGRYVVSATVGGVASADLPGYTRSYFPGTPNASEAQFVSMAASQDVVGIDFSMSRTRTARVSGKMLNAAGEPTTGGTVQLMPSQRST